MPVICISRTLGAGGEEIGQRVAEATGLRYVDNEIVSEAARRLRISCCSATSSRRQTTRRACERSEFDHWCGRSEPAPHLVRDSARSVRGI